VRIRLHRDDEIGARVRQTERDRIALAQGDAIVETARVHTGGGASEHVGARVDAGHAARYADVLGELAGEVADAATDVDTGFAGANVEQRAKAASLGDDLRAGVEHFEARAHRGVEDVGRRVGGGQVDLPICTDNYRPRPRWIAAMAKPAIRVNPYYVGKTRFPKMSVQIGPAIPWRLHAHHPPPPARRRRARL